MNKIEITLNNWIVDSDSGLPTEEVVTYEDVVAHQVGNGAVQIILSNGIQHVHFNPVELVLTPSEEEQEKWKEQTRQAYEADVDEPEVSEDSEKDTVH